MITPGFAAGQPPVANDDGFAVIVSTATVLNVLANDTDPESNTLTVTSVSTPTHGTAALAAGIVTYTPTSAYLGSDAFTYTISDGNGNFDTATVNIIVAATIGVPVAVDDVVNVPMNTASSLNVRANDTDPDGQALTITAVTTPAHGTAVIVAGTTITYDPVDAYTGPDTFTYTVSDGFGSMDTAIVTITVSTTGAAPIVQNDSANVLVNTSILLTVLANDTDPNGDVLTVVAVTSPLHGTATISGDAKTITYVPVNGYVGADSFIYTVSDGHGNTPTGTVAIVVVGQNALLARNDSATTLVDTAKTIAVLNNDVASNGTNALSVTAVTTPAHGTATISGNSVIYTPATGYIGPDTFLYTVTEAGGGTATAMVTITVRAASILPGNGDFEKDACKNGGWFELGFRNQGLCIAFWNHLANGLFGERHDADDDDDDDKHQVLRDRGDNDHRGSTNGNGNKHNKQKNNGNHGKDRGGD